MKTHEQSSISNYPKHNFTLKKPLTVKRKSKKKVLHQSPEAVLNQKPRRILPNGEPVNSNLHSY